MVMEPLTAVIIHAPSAFDSASGALQNCALKPGTQLNMGTTNQQATNTIVGTIYVYNGMDEMADTDAAEQVECILLTCGLVSMTLGLARHA